MQFHAKYVSASEDGDYCQISFDTEPPEDDNLDPRGPDRPYLIIQRQFESPDGGRCYLETHDEAYIGHFRLRLTEFTPNRLAVEIGRKRQNRVEVSYALDAEEFEAVRHVVDIIFGQRG